MILRCLLAFCLLLCACGYHVVGQGKAVAIPEGVNSASLQAGPEVGLKQLLPELEHAWRSNDLLPELNNLAAGEQHVLLRIEQVQVNFKAIAFDASGLANQYSLQISGHLRMYHRDGLIWQSGAVSVQAAIFAGTNPSVIQAERERLTAQLQKQWAKDALARLQSGF